MKVEIVGIPNAGKSSLFSALTGVAAEAAGYPFTTTTIEPNVAEVPVADIEPIETELIYAELEQAERRLERIVPTAKSVTGERSPRRNRSAR